MFNPDLTDILRRHVLWLKGLPEGRRADLTGADLYKADLYKADLTGADLYKADLTKADLTKANLTGDGLYKANLTEAGLYKANLTKANLTEAILYKAILYKANLTEAILYKADLTKADLTKANLTGANLTKANLTDTVLDPNNTPSGAGPEFESADRPGTVWAYRTRNQPYMEGPNYEDNREYTAPVFSTCPHTERHPGLYIYPELKHVYSHEEVILVRVASSDIHAVKGEYRCRKFTVIGKAALW